MIHLDEEGAVQMSPIEMNVWWRYQALLDQGLGVRAAIDQAIAENPNPAWMFGALRNWVIG